MIFHEKKLPLKEFIVWYNYFTKNLTKYKHSLTSTKSKHLDISQVVTFQLLNLHLFDNGILPKHFDSYFSDIASVHKY